MARREERAYWAYVSEEQRRQAGCPARELGDVSLFRDTSSGMRVIAVERTDDPRLSVYGGVADPAGLTRHGLFVVEGRLVLRRMILESPLALQSVLVTDPARSVLEDVLDRIGDVPIYVAPPPVLNAVAGFNMHRGCLAIGIRPPIKDWTTVVDTLPETTRLVLLDAVSNADNIGGIFRSAAALGAGAALLGHGCADPLYRKAIRTSMGATLVLPFATVEKWPAAIQELRRREFEVVALTPGSGAEPIGEVAGRLAAKRRVALLAGAEGDGLSEEALAAADIRTRIPMTEGVDSLNVTVAVGIALDRLRAATRERG